MNRHGRSANRRSKTMTTYTIDDDDNITALPSPEDAQDALALGAQAFTTRKEFTKLASGWPGSRFVEIWNSFAGVAPFDDLKPVKKFTDRTTATTRIWDAIQRLAPAAQGDAQGAPEAAAGTRDARPKKNAPRANRGAANAKKTATAAKPNKDAAGPREGSKKAIILELLRRPKGTTLAQLIDPRRPSSATDRRRPAGQRPGREGQTCAAHLPWPFQDL
jgi:hypothetical protein